MSSQLEDATSDLPSILHTAPNEVRPRIWFTEARRRRIVFWSIVVLLGFVQVWSHRQLVDHDGVAYLDIAEKYAQGP